MPNSWLLLLKEQTGIELKVQEGDKEKRNRIEIRTGGKLLQRLTI